MHKAKVIHVLEVRLNVMSFYREKYETVIYETSIIYETVLSE